MKHEHDGWLYVMLNGELVFQTLEHALRNGNHRDYQSVFRARNDWDYTRALEIAGRMYEDTSRA